MPQPRKSLGQHWLRSETALQQIVAAADLQTGDRILEIGPGTGVLTRRLIPLADQVIAVELDSQLQEPLRRQFGGTSNFTLIEGDILTLDLGETLGKQPRAIAPPNKVVANIPYYITGPILERLLGTIARPNPQPFDRIVLLVQKEVGERICAAPGSKIFGALSVRVQYLADCNVICTVPAKAFQPPPKVDSVVISLCPRPLQPAAINPAHLDQIVRLGFATKRKMLRNNLSSVVARDRLSEILGSLGCSPQARAEELGVADWVALSNTLSSQ
jgi:16S rRNA (adenine1518-N6/adenine1519-N6)-dimethyltransferase